jgi:hypothetical protein
MHGLPQRSVWFTRLKELIAIYYDSKSCISSEGPKQISKWLISKPAQSFSSDRRQWNAIFLSFFFLLAGEPSSAANIQRYKGECTLICLSA